MKDMHSHIIYGVDDGARDLEASRDMLRAAQRAGVTEITATPHVRRAFPDKGMLRERFAQVAETARAYGITMTLGYEVHWRVLQTLEASRFPSLCMENSNRMLIEFHMGEPKPLTMMKKLRQLQSEGVALIIAHPERYRFVHTDPSLIPLWLEMGIELQLDARELAKGPLDKSRRCAQRLLKRGVYACFASDAHCAQDYATFAKVVRRWKL